MAEPIPPSSTTPPPPAYDTSRINVRNIFWFVVCFAIAGAVILPGVWWMEHLYLRHPLMPSRDIAEPLPLPQPLQPSPAHPTLPWQDMAALRAKQLAALHSYAPSGEGHARIPIDRAIDLLLQSGDLQKPWANPTTQPYQLETQPAPQIKPPVENRT